MTCTPAIWRLLMMSRTVSFRVFLSTSQKVTLSTAVVMLAPCLKLSCVFSFQLVDKCSLVDTSACFSPGHSSLVFMLVTPLISVNTVFTDKIQIRDRVLTFSAIWHLNNQCFTTQEKKTTVSQMLQHSQWVHSKKKVVWILCHIIKSKCFSQHERKDSRRYGNIFFLTKRTRAVFVRLQTENILQIITLNAGNEKGCDKRGSFDNYKLQLGHLSRMKINFRL